MPGIIIKPEIVNQIFLFWIILNMEDADQFLMARQPIARRQSQECPRDGNGREHADQYADRQCQRETLDQAAAKPDQDKAGNQTGYV